MPHRHCRARVAVYWTLLATALGLFPSQLVAQDGAQGKRPNVIFILTDDQRWDQLSCEGHPYLETPHIDRLADEGVRFSHAFVTTSLCSPSRASYLSGLYAHTHGVVNNFTDYPADLPSYPRQLKAAGYQTAYIGKWHMGEADDSKRPGFDYWISHRGQGDYFDTEFNINGQRKVVPGYYTTALTDMTVDYLNEQRDPDQPFCLIVGHKAPHTPFTPEPKYNDLFKDVSVDYPHSAFDLKGKPKWIEDRLDTWHGIYGPIYGFRKEFPDRSAPSVMDFQRFVLAYTASIKSIDDSVGEVVATLEDLDLLDNTIIVYAGDNGMFLGEHDYFDKRWIYEECFQMPFLARLPSVIPAGSNNDTHLCSNLDFAQTFLDFAGLNGVAEQEQMQGRSLKGVLRGQTPPEWRDAVYYRYWMHLAHHHIPGHYGIRDGRYKLAFFYGLPLDANLGKGDYPPSPAGWELYDLQEDPHEMKNVYGHPAYASQTRRLKRRLAELKQQYGDTDEQYPKLLSRLQSSGQ